MSAGAERGHALVGRALPPKVQPGGQNPCYDSAGRAQRNAEGFPDIHGQQAVRFGGEGGAYPGGRLVHRLSAATW